MHLNDDISDSVYLQEVDLDMYINAFNPKILALGNKM